MRSPRPFRPPAPLATRFVCLLDISPPGGPKLQCSLLSQHTLPEFPRLVNAPSIHLFSDVLKCLENLLQNPEQASQFSLVIKIPHMLFYPLCSKKNKEWKKSFFSFSREPELPDFIQKQFYSTFIDKRAELTNYQTTEANIIGNIFNDPS